MSCFPGYFWGGFKPVVHNTMNLSVLVQISLLSINFKGRKNSFTCIFMIKLRFSSLRHK